MSFLLEKTTTLIVAAGAALLASAQAHAQLGGRDGPISWGADNVEMVDQQNLIRLEGRVNVRQGDARLAADEMSIYLAPAVEGQGRTAERIEAHGSVVYITPLETARGDRGVYVAAEDTIWLTGRVRLIRGEDAFCGRELVIHPQSGQFEAAGGGPTAEDPLCAGRVRGVISSESRQARSGEESDGGGR